MLIIEHPLYASCISSKAGVATGSGLHR